MKRVQGPWNRRTQAQVGIGTMIVFIATVLVAAIAAGVILSTTGKLQERSSRTGQEATSQVSSNIEVVSIVGNRSDAADVGLEGLAFYVTVAPGASDMDLSAMKIQLRNSSAEKTLSHEDGAIGADDFNVTSVRDGDGSFSYTRPVLNSGDLFKIYVDLVLTGSEYEPREHVLAVFVPEVGHSVERGFTTPPTYATDLIIELR